MWYEGKWQATDAPVSNGAKPPTEFMLKIGIHVPIIPPIQKSRYPWKSYLAYFA
jgi:hypothetical protein